MQILDEPKYAVVDAAPSFSKTGAPSAAAGSAVEAPVDGTIAAARRLPAACLPLAASPPSTCLPRCSPPAVGNFSMDDWGLFAGVTAVSFPLGWLAGAHRWPRGCC